MTRGLMDEAGIPSKVTWLQLLYKVQQKTIVTYNHLREGD